MEILDYLKILYNHWPYHTQYQSKNKATIELNQGLLDQISTFASERMRIWERKVQGKPQPYTQDQILNKYRFCNIYRELDRQTIEFHTLLKPLTNDFELWLLNMLFCRLICKPETIKIVGLLSSNKKNNKEVFEKLNKLQRPKYGNAYILPISLIQKSKYPTREEFFCFYLPQVINKVADSIQSFHQIGVSEALEKILPIFGFNLKFHWTEVLIDVAYQYPEKIDLFKKFPIGPGSISTMKLLSPKSDPQETCLTLTEVEIPDFPYLKINNRPILLSTENWEGIGCEYRKYSNLKGGKGRRRLYNS